MIKDMPLLLPVSMVFYICQSCNISHFLTNFNKIAKPILEEGSSKDRTASLKPQLSLSYPNFSLSYQNLRKILNKKTQLQNSTHTQGIVVALHLKNWRDPAVNPDIDNALK